MRPHRIEMIRVAAERGLGPATIEGVEVIGAGDRLRRFRKPVPSLPQLAGGAMVGTVFPGIGRPRFEIDEAACDSCATCVGACPAGAMQMEGGRPTCDYDRCIACYCCMELCPRQAVALKDTVATRLYRMLGHLS